MSLVDRLRASGVSEKRLYLIGLAQRAPDAGIKATDEELAIAHEYNNAPDEFAAAKIRARNPKAVANGRHALQAIDAWIDRNEIARKHGGAQ